MFRIKKIQSFLDLWVFKKLSMSIIYRELNFMVRFIFIENSINCLFIFRAYYVKQNIGGLKKKIFSGHFFYTLCDWLHQNVEIYAILLDVCGYVVVLDNR